MSSPQQEPAPAGQQSDPAAHKQPVIHVEVPPVVVPYFRIAIGMGTTVLIAAGLFFLGYYTNALGTKPGGVNVVTTKKGDGAPSDKKVDGKGDTTLTVSLEDVSSVFTYHLNMIAIIVGLASVFGIVIQVVFQMAEAKRIREQSTQMAHVMHHSGQLIQNMGTLVQTTAESMKAVNVVAAGQTKGEETRKRNILNFGSYLDKALNRLSITHAAFREQIRTEFTEAQSYAHGISAEDQPAEFIVLRGLFQGGYRGQSQKALEILTTELKVEALADPALRARVYFFRGHFAVRVGLFEQAEKWFLDGLALSRWKAGYVLSAAVARLYGFRAKATPTAAEAEEIVGAFERLWTNREAVTRDTLGKVEESVYWETLGLSYAALLIEGLKAEFAVPTNPLERADLKARLHCSIAVSNEADARYFRAKGSHNGVFDAARYEAGIRLALLGDGTALMSADALKLAVKRCSLMVYSDDPREKIAFTIRLARLHGRLAAVYLCDGDPKTDRLAEFEEENMNDRMRDALGALHRFKQDMPDGELLYSPFTNLYQKPEDILRDIESDIVLDKYVERWRRALDTVAATAQPSSPAP